MSSPSPELKYSLNTSITSGLYSSACSMNVPDSEKLALIPFLMLYPSYPFKVKLVPLTYNGMKGNYELQVPDFNQAVMEYNQKVVDAFDADGTSVIHCHDWITFNAGIELKERYGIPLG